MTDYKVSCPKCGSITDLKDANSVDCWHSDEIPNHQHEYPHCVIQNIHITCPNCHTKYVTDVLWNSSVIEKQGRFE